jgi:hypothetical protein
MTRHDQTSDDLHRPEILAKYRFRSLAPQRQLPRWSVVPMDTYGTSGVTMLARSFRIFEGDDSG